MSKIYRRQITETWERLKKDYPVAATEGMWAESANCDCYPPDGYPDPVGWGKLWGPFGYYDMWSAALDGGDPDDVVGQVLDDEWRREADAESEGWDDYVRGNDVSPYLSSDPLFPSWLDGWVEASKYPQQMELDI